MIMSQSSPLSGESQASGGVLCANMIYSSVKANAPCTLYDLVACYPCSPEAAGLALSDVCAKSCRKSSTVSHAALKLQLLICFVLFVLQRTVYYNVNKSYGTEKSSLI